MVKSYDKNSGAIIFRHTKAELEEQEMLKEASNAANQLKAICKMLGITEEDIQKALKEEESNG